MTDTEELFDEEEQELETETETETEDQDEEEPTMKDVLGALKSVAEGFQSMSQRLDAMEKPKRPDDDEDDEPDISARYDPDQIEERTGKNTLTATSLLSKARRELKSEFPDLPEDTVEALLDGIAMQGPKAVANTISNGGHRNLAKYYLGEMYVDGKLKAKRSDRPLSPTNVGPQGGPRDTGADNAIFAEYERRTGLKPTKEVKRILLEKDN